MLKTTIMLTCVFMLMQTLTAYGQFHLPCFVSNVWVKLGCGFQAFPNVSACQVHLPRPLLSISHLHDKSTIMRFLFGSHGQNVNILITHPYNHTIINKRILSKAIINYVLRRCDIKINTIYKMHSYRKYFALTFNRKYKMKRQENLTNKETISNIMSIFYQQHSKQFKVTPFICCQSQVF